MGLLPISSQVMGRIALSCPAPSFPKAENAAKVILRIAPPTRCPGRVVASVSDARPHESPVRV